MAMPHIDPGRGRVDMYVPLGTSIDEMVRKAMPELLPAERDMVRVWIGEDVVPSSKWRLIRPHNVTVIIRLVPGQDSLRSILTIAVAAAALFAAPYLGPMLAGAAGFGTAATWGSVAALGITLAGSLLVNALIPVRAPGVADGVTQSPTYAISGWKNTTTPGGPIPAICGRHRFAPVYAATPFSRIIGNDQYIVSLFLVGYGPLILDDFRIGETPLANFVDAGQIQLEVRHGYPDDAPITLYPNQVLEEAYDVTLESNVEIIRLSASDVTQSAITFYFPRGLAKQNDDSETSQDEPLKPYSVDIAIEQRRVGDTGFTPVASLHFTETTATPFFREHEWVHPQRGQYEIRIVRTSMFYDDTKTLNQVILKGIRSQRPEYPVNFNKPLALIALQIKASNLLSGVLDQFNLVAAPIIPDYDAETLTWIDRETSNPASVMRWMLQGPANIFSVADEGLDIPALRDWHSFCKGKGLEYNRVHDFRSSLMDAMGDCAAVGRATPRDTGSMWSVVVDRRRQLVDGHISPRNSWDFSFERSFARMPDAFRVAFKDETANFADSERIVPWPGFSGDPEIIEDLSLPGITDPDAAFREARRRQYELIYRADTMTVMQDLESLTHARGDMVKLSHDILDRTQIAARVISITGQTIVLDEMVTMETGKNYCCRFRVVTEAKDMSLLRQVINVPGETEAITVVGDISEIEVGNIAFFGLAGRETMEVIIKDVESANDLTARLTLVAHAPEIEILTDGGELPVWSTRVGQEGVADDTEPLTPIIVSAVTSERVEERRVGGAIVDTTFYDLIVKLAPAPGSIPIARYEVEHKFTGGIADIAMWGDSLTAGNGGGTPIPAQLATLLGVSVYNGGVSGQRSDSIAARQGGIPTWLTLSGNEIPATTDPVDVAFTNAYPVTASNVPLYLTGTLTTEAGIAVAGKLTRVANERPFTSGAYRFERSVAGVAIDCPPNAVFVPDVADTYRRHFAVIWAGTNSRDSVEVILADVAAMVESLPSDQNCFIMGPFNDVTEPAGTTLHANVVTANAALAELYGDRFWDVRGWLIQNYGTPTEILQDILPASQLADTIHPNATGKTNIANELAARLSALPEWAVIDVTAAEAAGVVDGYRLGEMVTFRARAFSFAGVASDYTDERSAVIDSSDAGGGLDFSQPSNSIYLGMI